MAHAQGSRIDVQGKNRSELMGVRTEFTECSSRAYKRALNSTVIKTCALCMMASSRLSSQLMLGVEPSTKSAEATQGQL